MAFSIFFICCALWNSWRFFGRFVAGADELKYFIQGKGLLSAIKWNSFFTWEAVQSKQINIYIKEKAANSSTDKEFTVPEVTGMMNVEFDSGVLPFEFGAFPEECSSSVCMVCLCCSPILTMALDGFFPR